MKLSKYFIGLIAITSLTGMGYAGVVERSAVQVCLIQHCGYYYGVPAAGSCGDTQDSYDAIACGIPLENLRWLGGVLVPVNSPNSLYFSPIGHSAHECSNIRNWYRCPDGTVYSEIDRPDIGAITCWCRPDPNQNTH